MPFQTRRAFTSLAAAALCALPMQGLANTRPQRAPAIEVEQAQIYLIRGLFGIFSSGMDEMAAKFRAQGYSNVSLWSWTDVEQIAHDIISGHKAGDTAHVVLIGHSLGSNAVVQVADRLATAGIPVDLAVTFDITENLVVPPNVHAFFNFYQNNGFGRPAVKPEGFTGEFSNIDLTNQTQLGHGNIDNAPQLQAFVFDRVYDITHTHVRTVAARRKSARG